MKAYVHKADGEHGGFVMLSPTAANPTEETRLGATDWLMITALLVVMAATGTALRLVLLR